MPVLRNTVSNANFNRELTFPFELRIDEFASALLGIFDFFLDANPNRLITDRTEFGLLDLARLNPKS